MHSIYAESGEGSTLQSCVFFLTKPAKEEVSEEHLTETILEKLTSLSKSGTAPVGPWRG